MAKYIGLDLGSVTCGIAISDIMGMLARTHSTLRFKEDDYDYAAAEVDKICKAEGVKDIVLGLPKHMNGDEGIRANISHEFKDKLVALGNYNVILWDERLTSVTVNRAMLEGNKRREFRKEHKDELAAVVILQGYLDFKR